MAAWRKQDNKVPVKGFEAPSPTPMPIEQSHCEKCGESEDVCPECGSGMVTARESESTLSPIQAVDYVPRDITIEYTHVCWDCGWTETVTMTVERETDA